MWLLTKEGGGGNPWKSPIMFGMCSAVNQPTGSHNISDCGAVTCENPSVAIIKKTWVKFPPIIIKTAGPSPLTYL